MWINIFRIRPSNSTHAGDQKVGWLELFYDLVYVATVVALGDRLSHDISLEGLASFGVLFVPIWWSWTGMAFHITRFNLDDVGHRLLVFAQMFAVSVLAISIDEGLGDSSQMFALGYVGARAILIVMYIRAGQQAPDRRALSTRYAQGFGLAAAIWLVSALVPAPARFVLWGAGLIVDFGTPLLPSTRRLQMQSPPSAHHLPERFGLLTIIVLGEAFIKVITSGSEHELHSSNALYGGLTLVIAASLWWMYFENIDGSVIRRTRFAGQIWVYTHLPLVASITAFGVASKKVVLLKSGYALADEYRLLLTGAVATTLAAIAILEFASTESASGLVKNRLAMLCLAGAVAVAMIGVVGGSLSVGVMLALVALVCAIQVLANIASLSRDASTSDEPLAA
jgi:low temperature requirement protein LtrA